MHRGSPYTLKWCLDKSVEIWKENHETSLVVLFYFSFNEMVWTNTGLFVFVQYLPYLPGLAPFIFFLMFPNLKIHLKGKTWRCEGHKKYKCPSSAHVIRVVPEGLQPIENFLK